ncbi:hypothetical protein RBB78_18320 [Tunturiibacter empetritectus]
MTSNKTSWIRPITGTAVAVFLCCTVLTLMQKVNADAQKTPAEYAADPAAMIDGYRHVEAASVSDAIEQLLHEKRYMSHRMQSVFPTKFAGAALTVKLIKQENQDPAALTGMLQAIDSGGAGSVYVMQVEDGADIAGMGGLMGTAMFARGSPVRSSMEEFAICRSSSASAFRSIPQGRCPPLR